METHKETIKCPNCGHIQEATVIMTKPFATFIHTCKCGYIITESEWEKVCQEEYIVIADYPEKYPNIFKTKNKYLTVEYWRCCHHRIY